MRHPALTVAFVSALVTSSASGCGAKTGLDTPDAIVDAAPDVVMVDAEVPARCIEVPRGTNVVRADFTVPVTLAVVDVFFLIDATASMTDEIENVRRRLADVVVPGTRAEIPDAAFGLGFLGEFPVDPHGPGRVRPYELRSTMTTDIPQIEAQLETIPTWGNHDDAEAQVEALYQVVTGEGLDPWITPSLGCPRGGVGGVCFRVDSLPVVVLITDAPMHNGPPGVSPLEPYEFEGPHGYNETVSALQRAGIFVIGLGARDARRPSPLGHLRELARDTGTMGSSGPLVFDIGSSGEAVGSGIVDGIRSLAEGLPLDVDAIVQDTAGDEIDARVLVTAVRPLRAEPPSGIRALGDDGFLGVQPGTLVTFQLEIDAARLPPSDSTRRVPARIIFRAFGRSRVGREDVVIVLPGTDGGGCDLSEGE